MTKKMPVMNQLQPRAAIVTLRATTGMPIMATRHPLPLPVVTWETLGQLRIATMTLGVLRGPQEVSIHMMYNLPNTSFYYLELSFLTVFALP